MFDEKKNSYKSTFNLLHRNQNGNRMTDFDSQKTIECAENKGFLSTLGEVVRPDALGLEVLLHTLEDSLHRHMDLVNLNVRKRGHQLVVVQGVVGAARLEDLGLLIEGEVLPGVRRVNVLLVKSSTSLCEMAPGLQKL